ncbi:MFS transporter [Microbacterium sp. gxy059]|uniref:MFS transporter n=1 Tax=Microbacterium sp. gxy059 TaxID=2957199 RepID=UPI003D973294
MRLGRTYWRFWAATAAVNLGDGIRVAAFPLVAASLTDDALLVGAVAAAAALPWLVTGLVAGAWADRGNARALLVGADALRAAVLGVLVVTFALDMGSIGVLAASAFLLGVGETVRDTTAQSAVPRLVPTPLLERANGRLVAGEVVANEFVGPLVGGVLFAAGAALPFLANSAVSVFAILLVLGLPALSVRAAPSQPAERAGAGVAKGLRWLIGHRTLRSLVLVGALVALADSAWFAIFVIYAEDRLGLGPAAFGGLLAVGAAGGLLGSLLAERLIRWLGYRIVVVGTIAAAAVTPGILLLAPSIWAAAAVVLVTSAGFGAFNVATVSLRHRLTPDALRGRVIAASRTIVLGAGASGALIGGAAGSAFGLDAPFVLAAALGLLALAVWVCATRRSLPPELPGGSSPAT